MGGDIYVVFLEGDSGIGALQQSEVKLERFRRPMRSYMLYIYNIYFILFASREITKERLVRERLL